jgi:hypothetical protein
MTKDYIISNFFKWIRNLFAGLWFAAASAIPVLFLIVVLGEQFPKFGQRRRSIVVLSILLSGIIGLFYGSAILNPEKIKSGLQASLRGLLVGLLSYLSLYVCFVVGFPIKNGFVFSDFLYAALVLGGIFGIGFVIVGWLVLITGTAAGWFLYLLRKFWDEPDSEN